MQCRRNDDLMTSIDALILIACCCIKKTMFYVFKLYLFFLIKKKKKISIAFIITGLIGIANISSVQCASTDPILCQLMSSYAVTQKFSFIFFSIQDFFIVILYFL